MYSFLAIRRFVISLVSVAALVGSFSTSVFAQATPTIVELPDAKPNEEPGAQRTLHANHGTGDVTVTFRATGTDKTFNTRIEELRPNEQGTPTWIPITEWNPVDEDDGDQVTIGKDRRVVGSDDDTASGNAHPVTVRVTVT